MVFSVFLDLEKAYDRVWKGHVINELKDYGFGRRLLKFIHNFLSNRTFQVLIGDTLSSVKNQETGLPQSSVISVPLFLIAINDLKHRLPEGLKIRLFADDVSFHIPGSNLLQLENQMQDTLDTLVEWENYTGFKVSKEKTRSMIFSKKGVTEK